MATTGEFEVTTNFWKAIRPDEIALIMSEDVYQIKLAEIIGSSGRGWTRLELHFPKVVGFQAFDVTTLPLALFSTLSADRTFKYKPVSGSLGAWVSRDSLSVVGKFHMEMKLQSDSDDGGPENLIVDGVFILGN
ncbi:hypothetical protein [Pseudomonas lini]